MDAKHQYNDFGICVKCHASLNCPSHYDNPDNEVDAKCECVVKNRLPEESQREWFKRWMCMHHWMQTDYYRAKLHRDEADDEYFRSGTRYPGQ
jgi:hypothetical protein